MISKKTNKGIKIIGLIIMIIGLGVGIFLLGRKTAKNANSPETKEQKTNSEKEIENIQARLQQAENKLATETNPDKKQKLQAEIDQLTQQLTNLKNNNPNNPPSNNPPTNPINNKTHHQLTVKYNTEVGGKHEYILVNDYKKRILIDAKNKIFSTATSDLIIKGNQYNFSFNEEDATEKKGNNFIFNENNTNFQLTPTTPSPGNQGPNNNSKDKIELEVKWDGFLENDYWLFTNSDLPVTKKRFHIAKNHPVFKGKKISYKPYEDPFSSPNPIPNFQLSFLKKDASKGDDNKDGGEYYFDENNQKFTLTPLGNWPNKPKTVKELKYASFSSDYITFDNMLRDGIYRYELESYHIHKDNPEAKRIDSILNLKEEHKKDRRDRKTLIFSYGDLNNLKQEQDGSCDYYFEAYNDTLEIKEKI